MASNSPNMKVNVTADNSDFTRKMKESSAAVKDFENVSHDLIGSVGGAFGINIDKAKQFKSAIDSLAAKIGSTGTAGAAAFAKIATASSAAAAGIAAIGVAGLVASYKILNEEAERFNKTVQGAAAEIGAKAFTETFSQAISDANQDTVESFANIQRTWDITTSLLSGLGKYTFFQLIGNSGASLGGVVDDIRGAAVASAEASKIATEIYETQRLISDKTVEWAKLEGEIAEYKRIAYDRSRGATEQQSAMAKVVELVNQRYQEEATLREKLADLQEEYNGLVSSTPDDIDKANQLRVAALNATIRQNNALRELSERQATITKNVQEEAEARRKAAEYATMVAKSRADLAAWNGAVSNDLTNVANQVTSGPGELAISIVPKLDNEKTKSTMNELTMLIASAAESLGESLGNLVVDLMTGEDAWGNFANSAISAFGDMAISIGKMAIATGAATLGIQSALASLNGYVAIAAGVALVALGTAVKSGLSNIANGGYSSSANIASAGSYSSSSNVNTAFDNQQFDIDVSGTLRADGNQLIAVIESEQKRRNHTT